MHAAPGLGHGPLEAVERRHITAVLARSATVEAAAAELGIDPSTLYRRKKAWGL